MHKRIVQSHQTKRKRRQAATHSPRNCNVLVRDGLHCDVLLYSNHGFHRQQELSRRWQVVLNGWLSDGLLLYRCHVIYAMNYRTTAFPSLVYLASFGIGFMYLFQDSQGHTSYWNTRVVCFGFLYVTISLSLNVLLTPMIVVRLILHHRMVRNAIGDPSTIIGLSKFVNTVLIESCALSAVSPSLYIASWIIQSYLVDYFCAIFLSTQGLSLPFSSPCGLQTGPH